MNSLADLHCTGDPARAVGLGLRSAHYEYIEQRKPEVGWFEVLIDNYLNKGGAAQHHLRRIAADYPLSFHGVGMNLGSVDALDDGYLRALRGMIDAYQPSLVSDHLCWTGVDGHNTHELLPLPYVEDAVKHVSQRIRQAQDLLGRQILIENVSSYLTWDASALTEWEFVCAIADEADCGILLDVNNVYVSACNHGFDPQDYLQALPAHRIKEFHLAGYEQREDHLLDTHGSAVHEPVWALYEKTLDRIGPRPTLIEWDNNLPDFPLLLAEAHRAQQRLRARFADVA